MYHRPCVFYDFLSTNNLIDEIYDAMDKDDLSEILVTAMKILKTTNNHRPLNTIIKSAQISEGYRNEGNIMYKNNDYKAFLIYNQAILTAPKNSRQLKLAISNRSALLYKLKAYKACLRDIDTCFEMGCPDDILIKLKKRRKDVKKLIAVEDFKQKYLHSCVDKFINCNIKRHPLVPCASTHVEFTGSDSPKIVAARDIKPGSVVSCEKAYISSTDYNYTLTACYYCQKHALHLIPCDNCCFAMFCDNICKDTCYHEYHKWECSIMEAKFNCQNPMANLMLKIVLKIRSKCMSWKELIDASYSTGLDRMRTSSIGEIYNGNNLFSVLSVRNDKPFVYGILYNASFICAGLLLYLEEIPSFYPRDSNEKRKAMRALGRIMLFISIYQTPMPLFQHITNPITVETYALNNVVNFGIFPFTGKLKKSCKPNLLVLNKNNELISIALRTIKSGEELTTSFQQHLLDAPFISHDRNVYNFLYYGNVCDCSICKGHDISNAKGQLTTYQKKYYRDLNFSEIDKNLNPVHVCYAYNKLLEALDVLADVPYSDEYKEVYKRFRKCTRVFETVKGHNFIIDK
ncbi:unnamed protein product [Euphydryas editha]|uniref:MYND-type domain-containing protein n=1 Tax=Euphydryas editha TaxID=104508 RepID=A0AAU9U2A2_EUPED|nr:unnamed protein product [Euphydryas editha]